MPSLYTSQKGKTTVSFGAVFYLLRQTECKK